MKKTGYRKADDLMYDFHLKATKAAALKQPMADVTGTYRVGNRHFEDLAHDAMLPQMVAQREIVNVTCRINRGGVVLMARPDAKKEMTFCYYDPRAKNHKVLRFYTK